MKVLDAPVALFRDAFGMFCCDKFVFFCRLAILLLATRALLLKEVKFSDFSVEPGKSPYALPHFLVSVSGISCY